MVVLGGSYYHCFNSIAADTFDFIFLLFILLMLLTITMAVLRGFRGSGIGTRFLPAKRSTLRMLLSVVHTVWLKGKQIIHGPLS